MHLHLLFPIVKTEVLHLGSTASYSKNTHQHWCYIRTKQILSKFYYFNISRSMIKQHRKILAFFSLSNYTKRKFPQVFYKKIRYLAHYFWYDLSTQVDDSGHRTPQEIAGTWKQYSNRKLSGFFPMNSCQLPVLSDRNRPEIIGKFSGRNTASTKSPGTGSFRTGQLRGNNYRS